MKFAQWLVVTLYLIFNAALCRALPQKYQDLYPVNIRQVQVDELNQMLFSSSSLNRQNRFCLGPNAFFVYKNGKDLTSRVILYTDSQGLLKTKKLRRLASRFRGPVKRLFKRKTKAFRTLSVITTAAKVCEEQHNQPSPPGGDDPDVNPDPVDPNPPGNIPDPQVRITSFSIINAESGVPVPGFDPVQGSVVDFPLTDHPIDFVVNTVNAKSAWFAVNGIVLPAAANNFRLVGGGGVLPALGTFVIHAAAFSLYDGKGLASPVASITVNGILQSSSPSTPGSNGNGTLPTATPTPTPTPTPTVTPNPTPPPLPTPIPSSGAGTPEISIVAPANNVSVNCKVLVRAHAEDDLGITNVEFLVDGTSTGVIDTQAPYSFTFNSPQFGNGLHSITARASDSNNNQAIDTVVVNVDSSRSCSQIQTPSASGSLQFLSPDDDFTITEGDVLRIDLSAYNPDDSVVSYQVQMNSGSGWQNVGSSLGGLPRSEFDSNKRVLRIVSGLGDAGNVQYKLIASRAGSNPDSVQVIRNVQILQRTLSDGPIIRIKIPYTPTYLSSKDLIEREEGISFGLYVEVEDIGGGIASVSGFPTGPITTPSWTVPGNNVNSWESPFYLNSQKYQWPSTYTGEHDAGRYSATVVAVDTNGNQSQLKIPVSITQDLSVTEHIYMVPNIVGQGNLQPHGKNYPAPMKTVSGVVNLQTEFRQKDGPLAYLYPGVDIPSDIKVRYRINDIPISPPVSYSTPFAFDTANFTLPGQAYHDGNYGINIEFVSSNDKEFEHRFQTLVYSLYFNNQNTASSAMYTPGKITVFPPRYISQVWSNRFDQFDYTGILKAFPNTPYPIPYVNSPVPVSSSERNSLLNLSQWWVTPILHPSSGLYQLEPHIYRTLDNTVQALGMSTNRTGATSEDAELANYRRDWWCGPPLNASVSPYSTFIPNPVGTGYYGVDISGRVFALRADGSMRTGAGIVNNTYDTVPPYHFDDQSIDIWQSIIPQDKDLRGDFTVGSNPLAYFNQPNDLAFDPFNPNFLYIADTYNHVIRVIDFTGCDLNGDIQYCNPIVGVYAGDPNGHLGNPSIGVGQSGYVDGSLAVAKFNQPYSIVFDDVTGDLYVADRGNNAIRKISPAGQVSTIAGGSVGPALPPETQAQSAWNVTNVTGGQVWSNSVLATKSISQSPIYSPQSIRLDSQGNPVFVSDKTRAVRRVNLSTGQVELHGRILGDAWDTWVWLDVDRHGNVGPVDDVIVVGSQGYNQHPMNRIALDGTRPQTFLLSGGERYPSGRANMTRQDPGHYTWGIVIDDTEARFLITGFGNQGPNEYRRYNSSVDVVQNDGALWNQAQYIMQEGTSPAFPKYLDLRPSIAALHGLVGQHRLGDGVLSFNDLANMTDSQIENIVRYQGIGGSVPRPEISGRDLRALIYYIRRNSQSFNLGFSYPALPTDQKDPEIDDLVIYKQAAGSGYDNYEVTFRTLEPTICVATISRKGFEHLKARLYDLETSEDTMHSIALPYVDQNDHYIKITCKDEAGNSINLDL
ncbi:MAG: hypothetical protein H6619_05690 [Deltaproteobacteria bacterium]|nr:hypothetical protein [Deltaproteobacteria bacterium]